MLHGFNTRTKLHRLRPNYLDIKEMLVTFTCCPSVISAVGEMVSAVPMLTVTRHLLHAASACQASPVGISYTVTTNSRTFLVMYTVKGVTPPTHSDRRTLSHVPFWIIPHHPFGIGEGLLY